MKAVLLLYAAFMAFIPLAASAQMQATMTVSQLDTLCNSKYDIDAGMCAGYITAIADRFITDGSPDRAICLNPAIAPQTLVDNVRAAWAQVPPQPADLALQAVEQAFAQRFHCP